jgi:hypothetical protein
MINIINVIRKFVSPNNIKFFIWRAKLCQSLILQCDLLIKGCPKSASAHPRVVEVPLPVDDGALGGPRALGHGDGGAEVLVGGLVRAADEAVWVEDLTHEVEGLEGDGLAAVVDLLREEGAQRAVAVEARLELLPEVAHELLLSERVAARGSTRSRRGHGGGFLNTAARAQVVCAMSELTGSKINFIDKQWPESLAATAAAYSKSYSWKPVWSLTASRMDSSTGARSPQGRCGPFLSVGCQSF